MRGWTSRRVPSGRSCGSRAWTARAARRPSRSVWRPFPGCGARRSTLPREGWTPSTTRGSGSRISRKPSRAPATGWVGPKTRRRRRSGAPRGSSHRRLRAAVPRRSRLSRWAGCRRWCASRSFAAAIVVGGWPILRAALAGLKARHLDMNVLMSAAVIGAAGIGQWAEAASVVVLFAAGNALQVYAVDRTRGAVRALVRLAPDEVLVRRGGSEEVLATDAVVGRGHRRRQARGAVRGGRRGDRGCLRGGRIAGDRRERAGREVPRGRGVLGKPQRPWAGCWCGRPGGPGTRRCRR